MSFRLINYKKSKTVCLNCQCNWMCVINQKVLFHQKSRSRRKSNFFQIKTRRPRIFQLILPFYYKSIVSQQTIGICVPMTHANLSSESFSPPVQMASFLQKWGKHRRSHFSVFRCSIFFSLYPKKLIFPGGNTFAGFSMVKSVMPYCLLSLSLIITVCHKSITRASLPP